MPINNVIGSPVVGLNFFDREAEQSRLWRRLDQDSILLLAPRRVGKTSLLHRLEAKAAEHEFHAVYVSVADRTRELDFIAKLYEVIGRAEGGTEAARAALRRVGRKLPGRLKKIEIAKLISAEFSDDAEGQWRELGESLLQTLRDSPRRWLFLVDELPLFVLALLADSRARARAFLNWFREARIDHDAGMSVRWLLAGSIGLDTVASRERLGDTINDLAVEPLGPFSSDVADRFLVALATSHRLELAPSVRESILRRIGWLIPYHLQLLFAALLDRGQSAPTEHDVDAAYGSLLQPARKASFDWWVQRLHDELGKNDAANALDVLGAVAKDDRGASRSVLNELLRGRGVDDQEHHRFLLDALENDGYLVVADGRYVFRSPLLRDYWRVRVLP